MICHRTSLTSTVPHHLQHSRTMDLDQYRVGSLGSVFYVPEYISETEEARLLADVHGARTKWQQVHTMLAILTGIPMLAQR